MQKKKRISKHLNLGKVLTNRSKPAKLPKKRWTKPRRRCKKPQSKCSNWPITELPVDLDKEMSQKLKEMAQKLNKAAERLNELNDKVQSGQRLNEQEKQELNELMQQLGAQKKEHQEQAMTPMEKFLEGVSIES